MTDSNKGAAKQGGDTRPTIFKSFLSFFITFVLLFVSWIVLSGKFDPLLLCLGGISSFFVAYFFYDRIETLNYYDISAIKPTKIKLSSSSPLHTNPAKSHS